MYSFEDEKEKRVCHGREEVPLMGKHRPSGDGMVRLRESGRWECRMVVSHKKNGDSIFHYVSSNTQKKMLDKLHRDMDAYWSADLSEESRNPGGRRPLLTQPGGTLTTGETKTYVGTRKIILPARQICCTSGGAAGHPVPRPPTYLCHPCPSLRRGWQAPLRLGHTNTSFALDTYAHVTEEMRRQAARVVGVYLPDIFGNELKPWQRAASGAAAAST